MDIITPVVDDRVEFLWFERQPAAKWQCPIATVKNPRFEGGVIYVDFSLRRKDAEKSERFDPITDRVILEIQDGGGDPIFEEALFLNGRDLISGTIGLK